MNNLLEIAVFSVEAALIADEAGADRLELCNGYAEGGITPSFGTIQLVKQRVKCPVYVMIRPRAGNFQYSSIEIEVMKSDIAQCKLLNADGIVLGLLDENGQIDKAVIKNLVALSSPLPVTFHRAFDLCHDPLEALEMLIECGVKRILTSGQKSSAMEGSDFIAELNKKANGRIIIMPGAGINPGNISDIKTQTSCSEFHASAKRITASTDAFGFGENVLPHPEIIAELKKKLSL
ncbi:MAG: copper homeostasis protein CutC [Bacteroidota bacterium]|nr:copper homeostasis protein CutC [Bacteroidota bacterium]